MVYNDLDDKLTHAWYGLMVLRDVGITLKLMKCKFYTKSV